MDSDALLLFGKLALKHYYVQKHELAECLGIQERMAQMGGSRRIGSILVDQGYISDENLADILRRQEAAGPAEAEESKIGMLAVLNGMAKRTEVEAAAKLKRKYERRRGENLRLGEVMVVKGILSPSQRDALLLCQARVRKTRPASEIRKEPNTGALLIELNDMEEEGKRRSVAIAAAAVIAGVAGIVALVLAALGS